MIQKMRERMGREEGFTLVELLVVMLILGLLAAIAIPSFFNQRDKAKDSDAKSAVRTMQTAIETYATDNQGSYAGADAGTPTDNLNEIESTLNDEGTRASVVSATADSYEVQVVSTNDSNGAGAQHFNITRNSTGTVDLECTVAEKDGCPTGGTWD